MARRGGLIGEGGLFSRAVEAVTTRAGVEVLPVESAAQLRGAAVENRMLERELHTLGWQAYRFAASQPQDMIPEDRFVLEAAIERKVEHRHAVADPQFRRAVMLRVAFCFGRGVQMPKAPDADVQEVIRAFWLDADNQVALLSPEAQWRKGWELWTQSNVFWVLFDDGLDGLVKLGQIDHDTVRDAVWDQDSGQVVNYYVVTEAIGGGWSYERDEPIAPTDTRRVYYEAYESSSARGGQPPEKGAAPAGKLKPGRMMHVAVNRHSRQAFGIPEGKATLRWAGAMNDLLGAQVERAKAAMSLLSKVSLKGSRKQLMETASRLATRRGPLGQVPSSVDGQEAPPAGARPGSQWWENEAVNLQPLTLDSQAQAAQANLTTARDHFSAGTNFGSHYYGGDPGSLAGSVALELPTAKLTDMDQELWEGHFKRVVDRAISRAVEVGTLTLRADTLDLVALQAFASDFAAVALPGTPDAAPATDASPGLAADDTPLDEPVVVLEGPTAVSEQPSAVIRVIMAWPLATVAMWISHSKRRSSKPSSPGPKRRTKRVSNAWSARSTKATTVPPPRMTTPTGC